MACDVEQVSSESSKKMKDMDETTSEASWNAVTKGKEKGVWSLEPEGEADKPGAIGPGSEVRGVSVNPQGESRHRHARANMVRKENQTRMEGKVSRKAPWDEGAEIQSPKRKVIWVESEQTQDYVRKSLNLSREEAEEISFVPSALSIPRGPMFWCDIRCSDKALRFWQKASVVIDVESCMVTLCQQCHNERWTAQGQAPLKSWQWKAVVEKKAHRGRLWKMLGKYQLIQGMWEYCCLERAKAKKFQQDAQWQQESPAKEYFWIK